MVDPERSLHKTQPQMDQKLRGRLASVEESVGESLEMPQRGLSGKTALAREITPNTKNEDKELLPSKQSTS